MKISLKRDPEMNSKETLEQFKLYSQYLKSNSKSIMEQFNSRPNARWKKNYDGFSIFVNDKMPISDIKLSFPSDNAKVFTIVERLCVLQETT